jgi:hypothetical protein
MMKKLLISQQLVGGPKTQSRKNICRSGPSQDLIKVKNPDSPAMRRAREGTL